MNHLYEIFRQKAYQGIFTDYLLHRFGYHGKLAGNLFAAADIQGLIPVIHGPEGCAFHYRLARPGHPPVHQGDGTRLGEAEVILGAEDNLRRAILRIDAEKKPDIILVLPTTVTDLIGSDIAGMVEDLRAQVCCKLAFVRSEVFSHRRRDAVARLAQDNIAACGQPGKKASYELEGCGFMEVMSALAEQVMTPGEKIPYSVNMETFGWGHRASIHLKEVETMFQKMGLVLNLYLPDCTARALMDNAARARLNIVRRGRRWAEIMRARFGTDYLFLQNLFMYHGISGGYRFFRQILDRLEAPPAGYQALEGERAAAERALDPLRRYFQRFKFAFVTRNYVQAPHLITLFERELGMPLKYVFVEMPEDRVRTTGLSDALQERIRGNIMESLEQNGSQAELMFNPGDGTIRDLSRQADFLVGFPKTVHYGPGVKVLNYPGQYSRLGFESFVQTAENLKNRMEAGRFPTHPLLSRLDYDPDWYPLTNDPQPRAAHQIWRTMWALRGR